MKIGILTLPLHSNYGGLLQVYALQLYLKRRGHEVIVIDRQFDKPFYTPLVEIAKRVIFRSKLQKQAEESIIRQHTDYFINTYIHPKTPPYTSGKALKKGSKKCQYDAVIVGSDQVWRLDYTKNRAENYFFDFIKNSTTKKLSYSASFGIDHWNGKMEETKRIGKLLSLFDSISVREDSGVTICSSAFGVNALQHADPTLLLTTIDYKKLVKKENEVGRKGNVLVYMLDLTDDKQKIIDVIVSKVGGSAFGIGKPKGIEGASLNDKIYPPVTSWLQGFFDAEYVITDSFHGTIFSILFNKPFVVYGNKKRGLARFYSMLKKIGLENRILLNSDDLTDDLLNQIFDWEFINLELEKERKKTDNYFKSLDI